VLFERYFTSVGVVSGGFFFKRLHDYIFPFRLQEQNFGELYEVTQPRNGDAASLWGAEFAFQNQLRFLPKPFDGKASWNFHGKYIDEAGSNAAADVYYDNHTQLDANVSQRIFKKAQIFVDVLNLTNAPLRYYLGMTTRPVQEEYYRWWSRFGVRVNW